MARCIGTPLLLSVTVILATGAPMPAALHAQRAEGGASRRAPRAESSDAHERELRRLEHAADSLAQLYSDGEEMSIARRRAIGDELDGTMARIEELARRMSDLDAPLLRARVQVAPMMDERDATAMSSALRQARASQLVMPRGWLGIVVSGTAREPRIADGELIIRYLTHPEIVSVEPSSPAERAGLIPSDTLVAYDGRDVRDRDISLTRLLRPNARVLVRIRREGRTRDIPVTIADVPSRIRLRSEATFEARAPRAVAGVPEAMLFPRGPVPATMLAPRAAMGTSAPMTPVLSMPPVPTMPRVPTPAMIMGYGFNGVAGAQLAALTDGLARTVGVRSGVLVTYAAVGSPAHSSGLRDGDVIVRVDGEPVRTVTDVRDRVQRAADDGESTVALECVRDRKPLKVLLRWTGPR
ncbi:MAG TPA: PDZ domain-containing protein [Gemmatimonadaceae bacterium]|nr:PDZ domain-containing protein [Gemmatimonadaceae bacterium]